MVQHVEGICDWFRIAYESPLSCRKIGLDHLLYTESGAGEDLEEAAELRVACFMGLVSFLSSRMEVLRVAPRHTKHLYNAAARAMIQSATVKETPLTDAGLDGTGEIIQVRWGCCGNHSIYIALVHPSGEYNRRVNAEISSTLSMWRLS